MPAEIGHGAASYTNVVTKSGVNQIHGSLFEFVRNAAFDARNYFDYKDDDLKVPQPVDRFLLEYEKDARARLVYDPDMDMIVFDHLLSESNEPQKKFQR